jgi:hypothetical protein
MRNYLLWKIVNSTIPNSITLNKAMALYDEKISYEIVLGWTNIKIILVKIIS